MYLNAYAAYFLATLELFLAIIERFQSRGQRLCNLNYWQNLRNKS